MTALPLLLVVRVVFAVEEFPAGAAVAGEVVIYLAPRQGGGPSAAAVSEAVAIYTRDLRLTVQTVASDKVEPGPAIIERVTALVRTRKARLAFWCVPSSDGRTIVLHWLDPRGAIHKEVMSLGEREGADVNRAVALKLRAILTPDSARPGPSERAPEWRETEAARVVPAPAPAEATAGASASSPRGGAEKPAEREARTPGKAPAKSAPTSPALSPVAADRPAGITAVSASSSSLGAPEISDWALALGYAGAAFAGAGDLRHGLGAQVVHGVGSIGEGEVYAGLEVGLPVRRTVTAGSLSVFDVPLRVGGRLTPVRSTVVLGVGVFGAVHVLSAGATASAGGSDDQVALAAGGGVDVVARLPMTQFSWELRAWGEALGPRTRFLVGGAPAADTGRFAGGVALGFVFPPR